MADSVAKFQKWLSAIFPRKEHQAIIADRWSSSALPNLPVPGEKPAHPCSRIDPF
jgi:hypothetical protein